MKRYFGTDGIRGQAGDTLTPELALRAAFGFAQQLKDKGKCYKASGRSQVILGSDPRLSSPMMRAAAASGLALGGCDVVVLGTVPTPVVAITITELHAAGGLMITASHNPVADNGIKFFGPDGMKLASAGERNIEQVIDAASWHRAPGMLHFGQILLHDAGPSYLSYVQPKPESKCQSIKLILDCAWGAVCELAPRAFSELGCDVTAINATFNGAKINVKCGATDLSQLARAVRKNQATLGLAFDGDGDRVLAVDEKGRPVSGDIIIALLASHLKRYRDAGAVVMTHMTNSGVEGALAVKGIKIVRTEVGDINVLAAMLKNDLHLGGEQSGHVIMRDRSPAGDGILTGLELVKLLAQANQPLSMLTAEFPEYPQQLTNLVVQDKEACFADRKLVRQLDQAKASYAGVRFYLRASGTENKIRILTEAREARVCQEANAAICRVVQEWDRRWQ